MAGRNKIPYEQALPILKEFVDNSSDYKLHDDPEGPYGSNHTIIRGFRRGEPVVFKCSFRVNGFEKNGLKHFFPSGLVPKLYESIQLEGMGILVIAELPGVMLSDVLRNTNDLKLNGPLLEEIGAAVWTMYSTSSKQQECDWVKNVDPEITFHHYRKISEQLPEQTFLSNSLDFQEKWLDFSKNQTRAICIRDIQCMVHADHLSGFIDFESVTIQTEAYQLGCALGMCSGGPEDSIMDAVWSYERFLEGYQKSRKRTISKEELAMSLVMQHFVSWWRIGLYCCSAEEWGEKEYTISARNAEAAVPRMIHYNKIMSHIIPSLIP